MRLFDSHCHFHDKKFNDDRDEAMARARDAGVTKILTLGDDLEASRKAIALADKEPEVIAAAGVHPSNAMGWNEETGSELERLLDHPQVKVLGEIGLDYYWDKDLDVHRKQHLVFREQLRLARSLGYSVSIHSRESNEDVLRILEEERGEEIGGVLHCFNGNIEEARRGLEMGFYLGVGGTATYKKSDDLRAVLKEVGPSRLLLETDAPYLPPQPRRGKRNEPAFVAMTCEIVAEALGMSPESLAEITYENTIKAFRLDE